jgi:uncharacterized protein (DUF3820 family)
MVAACLVVGALPGRAWAQEEVLIEIGEAWAYTKGTVAPPADWNQPGFDEAGWLQGPTGIGYGDNAAGTPDDATVLDDMMGSYMAFFARKTFTVSNLASVIRLVLVIDYDDGFVGYLNGVEVVRRGFTAGSAVAFDAAATSHEAGTAEYIDVGIVELQAGDNLLAFELHNTAIGSTDASFLPRLIANGNLPPTGLGCARVMATGAVNLTWTNSQTYDSIDIQRNGVVIDTVAGNVTTYSDAAPSTLDNQYQVIGVTGGSGLPSINTCTVGCTASTLTCQLGLVGGLTQASISWTALPGVTTTQILREGAAVATPAPGETSYVDPDVENLEIEDDTDYTVIQTNAAGDTCSVNCGLSLCPEGLTATAIDSTTLQLTWTNLVKPWDHFELSRDGVLLDGAIPGTATSFTDTTISLVVGNSYDYLLHPVAVPGSELPMPGTQCDETFTYAHVPEVAEYLPPTGGWDYEIDFTAADDAYNPVAGETGNLDGQWIRAIGVDGWDGSDAADQDVAAPDGPAPGGIDIVSRPGLGPCESDAGALRLLDPGNPGVASAIFPVAFTAPNNSAILLGLDLGSPGTNLLRSGITLSTRLRTSPDAPAYMNPQPASMDGAPVTAGIGQVGVYYRMDPAFPGEGATAGAAVALVSGANSGDLAVSTNPETDLDAAGISKFLSVWMTIVGGATPDTYDVQVYVNGSTTPSSEMAGAGVTLQGGQADLGPSVFNYLAIGSNNVGDDAMIEIDYVAYKKGVFPPSNLTPCEPVTGGQFRRGDTDGSRTVNITDPIFTLNWLFGGGPTPTCQDTADADDSGSVNITDPIFELNALFAGGPPVRPPGTTNCGPDPSQDNLPACIYNC